MEVIEEAELEKFSTLEKNELAQYQSDTYLDWLTAVPWSVVTEENYDIQQARKVLDQDQPTVLNDVSGYDLQFVFRKTQRIKWKRRKDFLYLVLSVGKVKYCVFHCGCVGAQVLSF
jgi:ATP-dependent Lon protease